VNGDARGLTAEASSGYRAIGGSYTVVRTSDVVAPYGHAAGTNDRTNSGTSKRCGVLREFHQLGLCQPDLLPLRGPVGVRRFARPRPEQVALQTQVANPFRPYDLALGFMLDRFAGGLNHTIRRGDAGRAPGRKVT